MWTQIWIRNSLHPQKSLSVVYPYGSFSFIHVCKCSCVCWAQGGWTLHPLETTEEESMAFRTRGGVQARPPIFLLLLRGRRLFALGTLTIWLLNHSELEVGGPSKAFPLTHQLWHKEEMLSLIHTPAGVPQEKGSLCQTTVPSPTLGPGKPSDPSAQLFGSPRAPPNRPICWNDKYLLWVHLNNPEKGFCVLSVIKNTPHLSLGSELFVFKSSPLELFKRPRERGGEAVLRLEQAGLGAGQGRPKGNVLTGAVFSFTKQSMCGLSLAPTTQVTEIFALGREGAECSLKMLQPVK